MSTPHALVPARRTARQREQRRIRIMGMVRSGFSYEEIARDERLSRERIRQIVTQSFKTDDLADQVGQARVQMARLEPALRLAARGVDNGKLSAINPLLRILDKLDKYGAVAEPAHPYWEGAHEQLIAKISAAAARCCVRGARANLQRPGGQTRLPRPGEAPAALRNLKPDLGWRKS